MITASFEGSRNFEILSSSGKIVHQFTAGTNEWISLASLSQGLYFIKEKGSLKTPIRIVKLN